MKYWLMKSEPDAYSIEQLKTDTVGLWDGVRNFQVRNMLRDEFQVGDLALFYHSNAGKETGVAGVMEVVSEATPDLAQFDPKSEYYDKRATKDRPLWLARRVAFVEQFPTVVTLETLKKAPCFAASPLIKRGNRLSIIPVTKQQFLYVCKQGRV